VKPNVLPSSLPYIFEIPNPDSTKPNIITNIIPSSRVNRRDRKATFCVLRMRLNITGKKYPIGINKAKEAMKNIECFAELTLIPGMGICVLILNKYIVRIVKKIPNNIFGRVLKLSIFCPRLLHKSWLVQSFSWLHLLHFLR
jgi:hypothetical protein